MNDAALIADLKRAISDLFDAREALHAACSERDALAAERDRLRTLLADLRPAIVARLATDPLGLDPSLLPRIDEAIA